MWYDLDRLTLTKNIENRQVTSPEASWHLWTSVDIALVFLLLLLSYYLIQILQLFHHYCHKQSLVLVNQDTPSKWTQYDDRLFQYGRPSYVPFREQK